MGELRHILIDEFQDFSRMFADLTHAITRAAPASVFAVGDDWQAINEFAGSDLKYFRGFTEDFMGGIELGVTTNYRSARSIVERGNVLMAHLGQAATPGSPEQGWVGHADVSAFTPNLYETTQHGNDKLSAALVRIVADRVRVGQEVAILARLRSVGWVPRQGSGKGPTDIDAYRRHLLKHLPEEAEDLLTISTAHAFKGKETDAVIVLQADERHFPFIHPTTGLFQVFGETPQTVFDAERRLFYVAATRAREGLLYLYDSERAVSPFITMMEEERPLRPISLDVFAAPSTGETVEIRVYVAPEGSGPLRAAGFRWHSHHKCWSLAVEAGRAPSPMDGAPWRRSDQRIKLCSDAGAVIWETPAKDT